MAAGMPATSIVIDLLSYKPKLAPQKVCRHTRCGSKRGVAIASLSAFAHHGASRALGRFPSKPESSPTASQNHCPSSRIALLVHNVIIALATQTCVHSSWIFTIAALFAIHRSGYCIVKHQNFHMYAYRVHLSLLCSISTHDCRS